MTLRDLLTSFRKHLVLVVATTVWVTVLVGALSATAQPVYQSSASLHFALGVGDSASDFNQGSTYTQNQMLTFAQLATLPFVLDPVIDELRLSETAADLARSITVERPQDSVILEISATSTDPARATAIANAVARQMIVAADELAPRDEAGQSSVDVRVVKAAEEPEFPIAPNTRRNVVSGFAAGVLLGLLLAYLRDVLDTRVRRPDDVARVVDVPVLASVSQMSGRSRIAVEMEPNSLQAEEYRRLRTNLRFLGVDNSEGLCIVFSSAMAGEGKSTTCVNLALALAEADMKVLLIDADMRRPRIGDYLGVESSAGLTTVLIGRASVDDVVQQWGSPNLHVLAAGEVPPNPSELVATRALHDVLDAARSRYDVVLIDAPPLLPVADAAILSRLVSGVILVADTKRLRRHQLREAAESVQGAGGTVLGVVLNRAKPRRTSAYTYESQPRTSGGRRRRLGLGRRPEGVGTRSAGTPDPVATFRADRTQTVAPRADAPTPRRDGTPSAPPQVGVWAAPSAKSAPSEPSTSGPARRS